MKTLATGELSKATVAKMLGPTVTDAISSGMQALGLTEAALKIGGNARRVVRIALHSVARVAIVTMSMSGADFCQQAAQGYRSAYKKVGPTPNPSNPHDDTDEVDEDDPISDEDVSPPTA